MPGMIVLTAASVVVMGVLMTVAAHLAYGAIVGAFVAASGR